MKFAVSALILDENLTRSCNGVPHFLGVSRKERFWDFGLPGGKVEVGESHDEAIVREVREETGLTMTRLSPVFAGLEGEFNVTTYYTTLKDMMGDRGTSEDILIDTVSVYELIAGCFGEYNLRLLTQRYPRWSRSMSAFYQYCEYLRHEDDNFSVQVNLIEYGKCDIFVRGIENHVRASMVGIHMVDDAFDADGLELSLYVQ